jgi:hypothetical protein
MLRTDVHWLDYVKSQPCLATLDWLYRPTPK